MIFCLRRLSPKLRVAGARYFRNSAPSAGLDMKTASKPRPSLQDSNSPPIISPAAVQTSPTGVPARENGEADGGELHNPYQGIPTAWQVAYESCFLPCALPPPPLLSNRLPQPPPPPQLGEPIDQFLARCVPSQTQALTGPWIWIANPHVKRQNNKSFDPAEALLREPLAKAQQDWARIIADSSLNKVWPPRSFAFFFFFCDAWMLSDNT